jgi:hypothetical protein
MEIYVMKKKFVLTLALVLMVAASLMAATPLEVSGSFKAGYEFTFASAGNSIDAIENGDEAEVVTLLDFATDFWKVSFTANQAVLYHDEAEVKATAEIYLDKALAEQGVDMGDLAVTLHVGDDVSGSAPTVFADKNDWAAGLSMATAADNFGVTVKYADLVTVYASVDPALADLPMVIGATFYPVEGVDAAVGYTNDANAIIGSAKIDVAKLAGLDFAFCVTAEDIYRIDAKTNELNIDAATTIEGIGLYVAYQMTPADVSKLAAKASYGTTVGGFGVSASFKAQMDDLADIANKTTYTVEAGANYVMGTVTYALDAAYEVDGDFTLTTSVSMSF